MPSTMIRLLSLYFFSGKNILPIDPYGAPQSKFVCCKPELDANRDSTQRVAIYSEMVVKLLVCLCQQQ